MRRVIRAQMILMEWIVVETVEEGMGTRGHHFIYYLIHQWTYMCLLSVLWNVDDDEIWKSRFVWNRITS